MAEEGYQLKNTGMSGENHSTDPAVETDTTTLMIQKLEHVLSLVGPAKEEVSHLQKQVAYQQHTSDSSATENVKHLQKELDNVKDEKAMLQQKINTEVMKKESEYHQMIKELMGKCTEKVEAFKEVNHDLEIRLQTALTEIKKKESLREQIVSHLNSKAEEQKQENARLSDSLKTARLERSGLEKELSDTKSRLSKLMGDKLSDNNPDIADLSDNNRPTKLAEKYQELYDNEWTDAFEVAEKYFSDKSEKIRIRILVRLLLDIYKHCQTEFDKQNMELAQALYRTNEANSTLPVALKSQIKEIKRLTARDGIQNVTKTYLQNVDKEKTHGQFVVEVKYFVQECVSVCWLMVHQDPPVAFHLNVQKGESFDSNKYKHYTMTGVCIAYVVWPALLLHEGGPVLSKGVAQCTKVLEGSKSVRARSRVVLQSEMGIPTGSVRLPSNPTSTDKPKWLQEIFASGNNCGNATNLTEETIKTSLNMNTTSKNNATEKTFKNEKATASESQIEGEHQTGKKTNDYVNSKQEHDPPSNQPTQHVRSEVFMNFAQNQPAAQSQSSATYKSSTVHQGQQTNSSYHLNSNEFSSRQTTANQQYANRPSASMQPSNQTSQNSGTPFTQTSASDNLTVNQ